MYLHGWSYEQINALLNGHCFHLDENNWALVAIRPTRCMVHPIIPVINPPSNWGPNAEDSIVISANSRHQLEEELNYFVIDKGWDFSDPAVLVIMMFDGVIIDNRPTIKVEVIERKYVSLM